MKPPEFNLSDISNKGILDVLDYKNKTDLSEVAEAGDLSQADATLALEAARDWLEMQVDTIEPPFNTDEYDPIVANWAAVAKLLKPKLHKINPEYINNDGLDGYFEL